MDATGRTAVGWGDANVASTPPPLVAGPEGVKSDGTSFEYAPSRTYALTYGPVSSLMSSTMSPPRRSAAGNDLKRCSVPRLTSDDLSSMPSSYHRFILGASALYGK